MEIDSSNGTTCQGEILGMTGSCAGNFIQTKDCDKECNLCACATLSTPPLVVSIARPQHCSGHGTCSATCTEEKCDSAKCVCEDSYGGRQCELGKYAFHVITIMCGANMLTKTYFLNVLIM